MIYYGTDKVEIIWFHLDDDKNNRHYVSMEQAGDENAFWVRTCCNPDWEWKFWYTADNYEMVKHAIWDAGFDADDMNDMLCALDEVFESIFDEIVLWDECDCEGGCEHCNCK